MLIAQIIETATILKIGGSLLAFCFIIACFVQGFKENSKQHNKNGNSGSNANSNNNKEGN